MSKNTSPYLRIGVLRTMARIMLTSSKLGHPQSQFRTPTPDLGQHPLALRTKRASRNFSWSKRARTAKPATRGQTWPAPIAAKERNMNKALIAVVAAATLGASAALAPSGAHAENG